MQAPLFVRGHLHFEVDNIQMEYVHQSISVFGVTGLPWAPLEPTSHFGKTVKASVKLATPEPFQFLCSAQITRETTKNSESMGLHFSLSPATQAALEKQIQAFGFYPTEYIRKYPRIPAATRVDSFPLNVVLHAESSTSAVTPDGPLIFQVSNLSPSGVLIYSEDQRTSLLAPDARVRLSLEPRGWFPMPIRMTGIVCRTLEEKDPQSGNIRRYLGIKFLQISDSDRGIFKELIKDILLKLKKTGI